jgi:hypothetical protein
MVRRILMKKLESQPVFKKTANGGRKMARKYRTTSLCWISGQPPFLV